MENMPYQDTLETMQVIPHTTPEVVSSDWRERLPVLSGKQVVLLGHSKGGVDAAAALSLYPELKGHVRALITMQAPCSLVNCGLKEKPRLLKKACERSMFLIGRLTKIWRAMA